MKNNPTLNTLKNRRKISPYTIETIAKNANLSKSMYSYLENGKKRLSYDQAIRLAKVFKTTPDKLFLEDYKEFFKTSLI